jgi:phenylacetate-coenzyme A ligase PaaK-like adenylate-forming protein
LDTTNLIDKIFNVNTSNQTDVINEVFQFQYANNPVYQQWCNLLGIKNGEFAVAKSHKINSKFQIPNFPFLPIFFFKSQSIKTTEFEPQSIFESSGTTQTINSKHLVKDASVYERSFLTAFEMAYGRVEEWCIIGLLPSYLERSNSSLVCMVDELVKLSKHPSSGFYLYDFDKLSDTLNKLEAAKHKTLIIGVTFALIDFADAYQMNLQYTIVMETGGMKGRKKEMTREEVHQILKSRLGVDVVHSEYGMTELLSQAYSKGNDRHYCPPWMKVMVRDEEDPLLVKPFGKGVINIIDLANIYSCSFIATEDVGEVFEDGSFKIYGRLDNSDLRGCSLMLTSL